VPAAFQHERPLARVHFARGERIGSRNSVRQCRCPVPARTGADGSNRRGTARLFTRFYGKAVSDIHHHVVFREGATSQDRQAWNAAKRDKWINVYGVNFVPDVLIRPTLDPVEQMLPIEVKLVTAPACSQSIATAIGQAIGYSVVCPRSIIFVGVHCGLTRTDHPLRRHPEQPTGSSLRQRLAQWGISLIVRPVQSARRDAARSPYSHQSSCSPAWAFSSSAHRTACSLRTNRQLAVARELSRDRTH
jgi:hypothetical protein